MLDKKIVTSSLLFTFIRYLNLFIGFLRTTFVALTLSKNNMGELVIIYLIIEYMSYLFSLGLPNSINLQASIDKNKFKNYSFKNLRIQKFYSIFFFIIFISSLVTYLLFYLASNIYYEFLKESFVNHYNKIFIVIFLMAIKNFSNNHNRLWEKNISLILSDLVLALIYFFGLYFLLEKNLDDPIGIILKVIIFSQFCSILVANLRISFGHIVRFDRENLLKLFPLGFMLLLQNMMELYFWGIDRLFISFYLSNENLASFHLAHTYARGLMVFFAAGTFLIYPRLLTTLSSLTTSRLEIKQIIDKAFTVSETILVSAFLFFISTVPYLMNLIFQKYDNFFYIFILIMYGLIIKSLTFFPVSFIVAKKKQKKLIANSFIFLLILIILYTILYKFKIIINAEEFTLTATMIFLLFSIRIYQWSMFDLNQKRIFFMVLNRFWRLISLYLIIFISYVLNLSQGTAIICLIFITIIIYFKFFVNNLKYSYSFIRNLYFSKNK
tara:strand:+ start:6272 stop:7759 length:1488 start_codon:yes stop_codon:yes gene_type:complete